MSFSQSMPLPTRLLDVGDDGTSHIRLCLGESILSNRRFTSLSHCWGDVVPLRLTRDSLESFMRDIDVDLLPKTFRDAIIITRKLGLKYLWVDSLCIIQDSDEDWKHEAAMMDRVYRGAWCNIAGTKSTDDLGGCFTERYLLDVLPCAVEAKWDSHPKQCYYCWDPDIWERHVDKCKLLKRGWVQQERFLTSRVLHFAQKQIYWECLELRACETFPGGLLNNRTTKPSLDPHSLRNDMIKYTDPALLRYRIWQVAVDSYSGSGLSKADKDKLLAISGLARQIGAANDYLAGLWRDILPYQLMWTASAESPGSRPSRYRAPSWSWASLDGPVFTRIPFQSEDESILLVNIISLEVTPVDSDRFGPIRDGFIRLQGPLAKISIRRCFEMYRGKKFWLSKSLANVFGDLGPFPDGSTVYCLPITRNGSNGSLHGIILEPTGLRHGEYYRRGYFALFDVESHDAYVKDFSEPLGTLLSNRDYEQYIGIQDLSGFHEYRIRLV
jgi:Heterokaryon incompatibility protein (HET)